MNCFDLASWADEHRYRWRLEESYTAEKAPEVRGEVGWYVEVPCRRGLIYLAGTDEMLAFTDKPGALRELVTLSPEVRVHQRGDREAVVRFPVTLLEAVASVLRPRRRRRLSPEARDRLVRAGAQTRFSAAGRAEARDNDPEGVSGQNQP